MCRGESYAVWTSQRKERMLPDMLRSLEAVDANVLGTVMNNLKASRGGYYYGYKYE